MSDTASEMVSTASEAVSDTESAVASARSVASAVEVGMDSEISSTAVEMVGGEVAAWVSTLLWDSGWWEVGLRELERR